MLSALLMLSTMTAAQATPMEAGLRGRYLTLPDAWMNPWLVEESPSGFARPQVNAWITGAEFTLNNPDARWTFYLERTGLRIDEGYWDDVDEPADPNDGHWVKPEGLLGLVTLGANVGQQWAITDKEKDVWLGFVLNGGLGAGILTGKLTRWTAGANLSSDPVLDEDCLPNSTADLRYTECGDDGEEPIPPVLPLIDLNLGFNLNITEHAYFRIEGGLHTFVYGGIAAGGRF